MNRIAMQMWAITAALIVLTVGSSASAQETWALFQVDSGGINANDAATFRTLLQSEIVKRNNVRIVRVEELCADAVCATSKAKPVGAVVAVTSSLAYLGEKVIVTVDAYNVADSSPKSSQRMSVDKVEELDIVASRIAAAFASYQNTEENAELGMITTKEAKKDIRREADSSFAFSLGALFPTKGYTGSFNVGALIDLAYWYEARNFAMQTRVGFRFHPESDDSIDYYFEMPIDIGGFWIMSPNDFSPYIGGGGGLRYLIEERRVEERVGSVIQTQNTADLSDDEWGFSVYGRVGMLVMRTYSMRLSASLDYNITFVDLNGDRFPQSITLQLTAIL